MEPGNREEEAAGAGWIEGSPVKKSESDTETTTREEEVNGGSFARSRRAAHAVAELAVYRDGCRFFR
jgi:hypothetical protein